MPSAHIQTTSGALRQMCSLRYLSLLHLFDRNTDLPQAVTCPAGLRIRSLKHTENIKDTAVFVEVVFNVGISGVHADDSSWEEAWSTEKKMSLASRFIQGFLKKPTVVYLAWALL